jgi:hypothetical protein
VWHPLLDGCGDLKAYLHRNKLLPDVDDDLKQSCMFVTKHKWLSEGREIGTEAVRKEMNAHYFSMVENHLLVRWMEGLTQEGVDEVLKKTKELINAE